MDPKNDGSKIIGGQEKFWNKNISVSKILQFEIPTLEWSLKVKFCQKNFTKKL